MLGQSPSWEGFSLSALVGTSWFTEKAPLQAGERARRGCWVSSAAVARASGRTRP